MPLNNDDLYQQILSIKIFFNRVYNCYQYTNNLQLNSIPHVDGFKCYKYNSYKEAVEAYNSFPDDNINKNDILYYDNKNKIFKNFKDRSIKDVDNSINNSIIDTFVLYKWIPKIFDKSILKNELKKMYGYKDIDVEIVE